MMDILGLDISTEKISYVLLSDNQINKYGEVFSPLRGPKGGVIKNPPAMLKSFESLLLELKDRKSTRLNSSHVSESRMPSSA